MCKVAVRKGDDGGHARTCSRVSRCECNGVECERRNTKVCVGGVETTTATEGQGLGSGRSCNGDRAGLAQQRACGSGRATHETNTCSAAGVKPGPGTPAVDVSLSRGQTKARLGHGFGTDGFSTRAHVLCPSVTCAVHSANRTHCAGHVEFHTRARLENPSVPDP